MKHKSLWFTCARSSASELRNIVEEHEGELPQKRKAGQGRAGEEKLRLILEINEHLRKLQHNERGHQLWEKSLEAVREWWLESQELMGLCWLEDMERSLSMMWNNNDSVWLLECAQWEDIEPVQMILQGVRDTLKQTYPTDNHTEQYPHTIEGRGQLLATFQHKLKQWQDLAESLKQQHKDLVAMLRYWPEQVGVSQAVLGTIMQLAIYIDMKHSQFSVVLLVL